MVVTDPGSPLEATAREMGAHVVLADPDVGGRYSALTAFGLVPARWPGSTWPSCSTRPRSFHRSLGSDADNPALALGAALGAAAPAGRDKVALVADGTGIVGLGDWAEQLHRRVDRQGGPRHPAGRGRDARPPRRHRRRRAHRDRRRLAAARRGAGRRRRPARGGQRPARRAVPGLGVRHRDRRPGARHQPVRPAQRRPSPRRTPTRSSTAGLPAEAPSFTEGAIEVYGGAGVRRWPDGARAGCSAAIGDDGYLAVMAYLDRFGDARRRAGAAAAGRARPAGR